VPGDHRVNERIRVETVRLIDNEGNQRGVMATREALALARSLDLDLVEIAPTAQPPVCRIMDYGKFKFDEAQKAKESRRKTLNVGVKEMKYRPKIGPGDFDTKTRLVEKFLNEGHKVKVTIMFRGRESAHPELGKKILDRIVEKLDDVAKVESAAEARWPQHDHGPRTREEGEAEVGREPESRRSTRSRAECFGRSIGRGELKCQR
jgi:translation initiation factor IF-3